MSLAHVIVDVFTDTPLQGNQLAVSEDGPALSDDQMQRLAREMTMPSVAGSGRAAMVDIPSAELAVAIHRGAPFPDHI